VILLIASIPLSFKERIPQIQNRSASYLDLHLEIDSEGRLRTKPYHKRDDFNLPIVNFTYVASFQQHLHMEYIISQLIRYSRDCGSYQEDFLDRRKLLNKGFLLVKLKSSLRKFYGRHQDMVDLYGISVSPHTDHGYVPLVVNTSRAVPH